MSVLVNYDLQKNVISKEKVQKNIPGYDII